MVDSLYECYVGRCPLSDVTFDIHDICGVDSTTIFLLIGCHCIYIFIIFYFSINGDGFVIKPRTLLIIS